MHLKEVGWIIYILQLQSKLSILNEQLINE